MLIGDVTIRPEELEDRMLQAVKNMTEVLHSVLHGEEDVTVEPGALQEMLEMHHAVFKCTNHFHDAGDKHKPHFQIPGIFIQYFDTPHIYVAYNSQYS